MERYYFDNAATTPVDPAVLEAMLPFFSEKYGNATSSHSLGREAQKALEDSRQSIADIIGAKPREIIFNSGATEGANHVIFGLAYLPPNKGKHIIVSSIEHHCVLEPIEHLITEGYRVTYIDVNSEGFVNPDDIKNAISDDTILVAVMHANNVIGTIQPISEIGQITKKARIPFLVDAVQTAGHIPLDIKDLNCDFLTLSAHKIYGPKGIGALYLRDKQSLPKYLLGGDQERDMRASTQNVAGAVGLAHALAICHKQMDEEIEHQSALRDKFIEGILNSVDGVRLNGPKENRLPNNAHFSFDNIAGESLLMSLDMEGFAASMGSACTSGAMEPSHVLRAIGLSDQLALGSLRLTTGRFNNEAQVNELLEKLPDMIKSLRI